MTASSAVKAEKPRGNGCSCFAIFFVLFAFSAAALVLASLSSGDRLNSMPLEAHNWMSCSFEMRGIFSNLICGATFKNSQKMNASMNSHIDQQILSKNLTALRSGADGAGV